jgi:hypothetical protein
MTLLAKFDESIRTKFNYDGGDLEMGWKGLTWEVLDVWFDKWLEIERDFALSRYQEIISDAENGKIDYDSTGPGRTKPTFGAVKVTDLLETIDTKYEELGKLSHKVRFLIDIQLAILDNYHNLLRGSLDKYTALTSTVGRTLHGATKEDQAALEGVGGLESLCKVYGSSDYIIFNLKSWSLRSVSAL